jgi:hypothetical protein
MNENPYSSPPDFPAVEKAPSQKHVRAYHIFVSVHHWTGINLLGVLLLCLWIIPIAILGDLLGERGMTIAFVGLAAACALIDMFVHNCPAISRTGSTG